MYTIYNDREPCQAFEHLLHTLLWIIHAACCCQIRNNDGSFCAMLAKYFGNHLLYTIFLVSFSLSFEFNFPLNIECYWGVSLPAVFQKCGLETLKESFDVICYYYVLSSFSFAYCIWIHKLGNASIPAWWLCWQFKVRSCGMFPHSPCIVFMNRWCKTVKDSCKGRKEKRIRKLKVGIKDKNEKWKEKQDGKGRIKIK